MHKHFINCRTLELTSDLFPTSPKNICCNSVALNLCPFQIVCLRKKFTRFHKIKSNDNFIWQEIVCDLFDQNVDITYKYIITMGHGGFVTKVTEICYIEAKRILYVRMRVPNANVAKQF